MGAKCLKPQKALFPVYVTQLNKIYQQALQAHHTYQNQQSRNIDLIPNIQNQLKHKGSLKKLVDHLSSHKSKIADALEHCYVLLSSSQRYVVDVTTVIIIKKIIQLIKQSQLDSFLKTHNNIQTQKQMQPEKENNQEHHHHQIGKPNLNSHSSHGVNNGPNQIIENKKKHHDPQFVKKAQTVFGKLIDLILQKNRQPNLIAYTSNVIADYSEIKVTTYGDSKTVALILQKLVHILKIIPKSIKVVINAILKAYLYTLQKFKFNTVNETFARSHIRFFLHLWSNDAQYKPYKVSVSMEHSQNLQRQHIENIIRQFLQSSIGSIQWQYVLQEILGLYDHYHFSEKIIPIQEVLFHSVSAYQLRQQFRHRSFNYFIQYLSVIDQQNQGLLLNSQFSYNIQQKKSKYPFILNIKNKINCINTIERWANLFKLQTLETLKYQKNNLFQALFINISVDMQLYKKIVDNFNFFIDIYPQSSLTLLQIIVTSLNYINFKKTNLLDRVLNLSKSVSQHNFSFTTFHIQILMSPLKRANLQKSWYTLVLIMCFFNKINFYEDMINIQILSRFLLSIYNIISVIGYGDIFSMQIRFIRHCQGFYKALCKYQQILQAFKQSMRIKIKKSMKQLVFLNLIVVEKCSNQNNLEYLQQLKKVQIDHLRIRKNFNDKTFNQDEMIQRFNRTFVQYQQKSKQHYQKIDKNRKQMNKQNKQHSRMIYQKALQILKKQNTQQMLQNSGASELQHHLSRTFSFRSDDNSIPASDSTFLNMIDMIKIT